MDAYCSLHIISDKLHVPCDKGLNSAHMIRSSTKTNRVNDKFLNKM